MQTSFYLKPGDSIGIVAPAGKISSEPLHKAIQIISSWGLRVVVGKNVLSPNHSYFSGSDKERLDDLQEMLDRPDVCAVLCARGGYGITRILDQIDFSAFLQKPKWIVGFSDITALHLKIHQLGIESIHGPMPLHFFKAEYMESAQSLKDLLFGKPNEIKASPHNMNKPGNANGKVIGGNLSLLADALGTATSPETKNKILVIEEIGEYKYRLDRMFTQLKRAGKLEQLSALIIGHMTDIKDAEPGFGETVEQIVVDKVKEYNYPVAFNFPIGHEPINMPWVHGGNANLSINEDGSTLSFRD